MIWQDWVKCSEDIKQDLADEGWQRSCSGSWAAALELVVIETFGVRKYERFSSWDVTPVADTVPKTMH